MKMGMMGAGVSLFVTCAALGLAGAGKPELEITRSTIDAGGILRSTGGAFEVSGTVGQFDAGIMTGGVFEVYGGFWFPVDSTECDDNGLVDYADHAAFTGCMLGPGGGLGEVPCPCYDADHDLAITLRDYASLQAGFGGQ
ncbi:MAG: hypothetical protein PVI86_19620 [Phycisphaerae bacterium]